ncbi:MAG TPA: toll/interleukin-1 receptor domain-containing protein, partial [Polyangiaceae bacterium]|nr:toll/interleukin-1 receptor domain-containing protein [Polyangiaceae bacterium]
MNGGHLQDLVRLGSESLTGRVIAEGGKERLLEFLGSAFGQAAARRAGDVVWIALELVRHPEGTLLAVTEAEPLTLEAAAAADLRVLGRVLPDDVDARTLARARASGALSSSLEGAAETPLPIALEAWLSVPANRELVVALFGIALGAECSSLLELPALAEHPLVPPPLAAAVLELSRTLRTADVLREVRCVAPLAAPTSARVDDDVQFTVYKPRGVAPGVWTRLLAFAHLGEAPPSADAVEKSPREQVREQAETLLGAEHGAFEQRVEDSMNAIPRHGELTFVPEFAGVQFQPEYASVIWDGKVHRVEFQMRAGRALRGKVARGQLRVLCGGLVLAELNLTLRVEAARAGDGMATFEHAGTARSYRKIFASYSHFDVAIVERVRSYANAIGDRYLIDHVTLRSGEEWSPALERMIREADVFQLFWSRQSMLSPFVRREWEYALSLRRANFVRPTFWEMPLPEAPGLPPAELKSLHFSCIALPDAPAPASAGLGLLGGLATGSAAVFITIRTGALDRANSAQSQLSEAAARVFDHRSSTSDPPGDDDSGVIVGQTMHDPTVTVQPVPELEVHGVGPFLAFLFGVFAVWRGRRRV